MGRNRAGYHGVLWLKVAFLGGLAVFSLWGGQFLGVVSNLGSGSSSSYERDMGYQDAVQWLAENVDHGINIIVVGDWRLRYLVATYDFSRVYSPSGVPSPRELVDQMQDEYTVIVASNVLNPQAQGSPALYYQFSGRFKSLYENDAVSVFTLHSVTGAAKS